MEILEPLVDFEARILCLSPRTPISAVIDRLLRLQCTPEWRQPITLYLGTADDADGSRRPLSALEFLQLHSVLKRLRSPVHATALGLLRSSFESLLLASCTKGKRFILPTAMVCVGPLEIGDLPLSESIGLGNNGTSLRDQAKVLVQAQLDHITTELGLASGLWETPRILTASAAIKAGMADAIVPIPTLQPEPERDGRTVKQQGELDAQRQFQRDQH